MEVTEVLSRKELKKLLSFRLRQGITSKASQSFPYDTLEQTIQKHRTLLMATQDQSSKPVFLNFALNPDPVSCLETMNYLIQNKVNIKSPQWTLLEQLILNDKLLCLKDLIESRKVKLQTTSQSGQTLLHLAAARDDWQLTQFLLQRHLDPMIENGLGNTCIDVAIRYGSLKVLKILFQHIQISQKQKYNKKLVLKLPIIDDGDFIRCHQYINPQARYPVKVQQHLPIINKILNNELQLQNADHICLLISQLLDQIWMIPNGKLIYSIADSHGNTLESIRWDLEEKGYFDRKKLQDCLNYVHRIFKTMVNEDDCHGQQQLHWMRVVIDHYLRELENMIQ